jgi:hypothetical protein
MKLKLIILVLQKKRNRTTSLFNKIKIIMKKQRILNAISATSFIASFILFFGWLFRDNISGWWWFSLFLTAVFFDEL